MPQVDTFLTEVTEHCPKAKPHALTTNLEFCLSRQTMLTMVFKLCQSAEKRWRRLRGYKLLGEVVRGVQFVNGVRKNRIAA